MGLLGCITTITLVLVQENEFSVSDPPPIRSLGKLSDPTQGRESVCVLHLVEFHLSRHWGESKVGGNEEFVFCCEEVKMLTLSMPSAICPCFSEQGSVLYSPADRILIDDGLHPVSALHSSTSHGISDGFTIEIPVLQDAGYFVRAVLTRRKDEHSQEGARFPSF